MSRLIRTSKSASSWTDNELEAYRITVEEQDVVSFFGRAELPEPNCPKDFLRDYMATENTDWTTEDLLWTMGEAEGESGLGEVTVDQFARALFRATGFTSRRIHPSVGRPLPFLIGGEERSAQTDVCLVYDDAVLLLVQEDKAKGKPAGSGEAQLVAEAVAARRHNVTRGVIRRDVTEIVPAVLMIGTYPVFYKVPVSAELSLSIASLGYPEAETVVMKCSPRTPRPGKRYGEGMQPLDSRAAILRYLEAFRRHVFIPCSEETLGIPLDLSP